MKDLISRLDSERFGFPVAKFSNNIENPDLAIKELKKLSTKLIIARIDFKNIKLINKLEKIGFSYKDAQVTFSFDLHNRMPTQAENNFIIKAYDNRHYPQIVEMTKLSFANYGHYFADDNLDKEKCLEIYVDWIHRCCENKELADNILVAEKDDNAIGYLALKTYSTEKELFLAGVIGAVAPEFRRLGVFQAINIESLYLAKNLGVDRIENNVLVTNFPVMKTYTSLSYNVIRSEITMHYWYG